MIIPPAPMSMDKGTSSAVRWINLTTLLCRRFASFGRAALRAFGDPKVADVLPCASQGPRGRDYVAANAKNSNASFTTGVRGSHPLDGVGQLAMRRRSHVPRMVRVGSGAPGRSGHTGCRV